MFSTTKDDDLTECPYNKYHRIARKRFQTHLLKCRLSYPDSELRKCPFNATHLVPEPEFTHHVTTCPDKALITQYKYNAVPLKTDEEDHKQDAVDCDENWDDTEATDYDPNKYASQAKVIRTHYGELKSSKKEFRKNERRRLGDIDSSDDEGFMQKVYGNVACKNEEGDVQENGWFEDRGAVSTSSTHHRVSYEESLKEWSKERGLDERDKLDKKSIKRENSDSEEECSKKKKLNYYSLDEDPYYKSHSKKPDHGRTRGGSRSQRPNREIRNGRY